MCRLCANAVAHTDESHKAIEKVIAVIPAAQHMKIEIELGRGGNPLRARAVTGIRPATGTFVILHMENAMRSGIGLVPGIVQSFGQFGFEGNGQFRRRIKIKRAAPLEARLVAPPRPPIGVPEMIVDGRIMRP